MTLTFESDTDMQYVVLSVLFATIIHLNHGYRILGIFPANLPSHSMMYQTLMTNLAKRGHTVDVISEHPLKKPFPNYTDIPFNSGLPKFENNFTLAQVRSYVPRLIDAVALYEGNRVCEQMKSSVIQDLVNNPPNDPPYDLLITAVRFKILLFKTTLRYNSAKSHVCNSIAGFRSPLLHGHWSHFKSPSDWHKHYRSLPMAASANCSASKFGVVSEQRCKS